MTKGKCLVQMREVKGMRLRAGLWLLLFLVMLGVAARQFSGTLPLQTNLLALLPETERNPVAEVAISRLADALGNRAVFLVSAGKAESSASAAREFAGKLRETPVFRHVLADLPPIDPRQLTDFYRPWRFNLLSDADAGSLAAEHFDAGGNHHAEHDDGRAAKYSSRNGRCKGGNLRNQSETDKDTACGNDDVSCFHFGS